MVSAKYQSYRYPDELLHLEAWEGNIIDLHKSTVWQSKARNSSLDWLVVTVLSPMKSVSTQDEHSLHLSFVYVASMIVCPVAATFLLVCLAHDIIRPHKPHFEHTLYAGYLMMQPHALPNLFQQYADSMLQSYRWHICMWPMSLL